MLLLKAAAAMVAAVAVGLPDTVCKRDGIHPVQPYAASAYGGARNMGLL